MMTRKNKREAVTMAMREQLLVNRTGKLTATQWLDMVIYPALLALVILLPLSGVVMALSLRFTPRLCLIVPFSLLLLLFVLVMRAYHYARLPVYFATLTLRPAAAPARLFRRSVTLYDEKNGLALRCKKWLSPRPHLVVDQDYIVYYLNDHGNTIILSLAPANHPDVDRWQPTEQFQTRLQQREGL